MKLRKIRDFYSRVTED